MYYTNIYSSHIFKCSHFNLIILKLLLLLLILITIQFLFLKDLYGQSLFKGKMSNYYFFFFLNLW